MTKAIKTQLRGNCQCCGRQQAATNGRMAKHGYTVKNGWFQGVCNGENYAPMQVSREMTDKICAQIREECAELREKADQLRAGKIHPTSVMVRKRNIETGKREEMPIPFADADPYQQRAAVQEAIWKTEQRARMGSDFANDLQRVADNVHGRPLLEVTVEAGPAHICFGERRVDGKGDVLVCTRVEGARVYWKTERGFKGWTGTAAWRRLEMAK